MNRLPPTALVPLAHSLVRLTGVTTSTATVILVPGSALQSFGFPCEWREEVLRFVLARHSYGGQQNMVPGVKGVLIPILTFEGSRV